MWVTTTQATKEGRARQKKTRRRAPITNTLGKRARERDMSSALGNFTIMYLVHSSSIVCPFSWARFRSSFIKQSWSDIVDTEIAIQSWKIKLNRIQSHFNWVVLSQTGLGRVFQLGQERPSQRGPAEADFAKGGLWQAAAATAADVS